MTIAFGLLFLLLGGYLLWSGTMGSNWANTHTRFLAKRPRYAESQVRINNALGRLIGSLVLLLGGAMLVTGVARAM